MSELVSDSDKSVKKSVTLEAFKRSDPLFNKNTHDLSIPFIPVDERFFTVCFMCSERTNFNTSCWGHALCDTCVDDCESNCFYCNKPLGFIRNNETRHENPRFEGLSPSFSIFDYAVKPLYPEYCFFDYHGVSCHVYCFIKGEVPKGMQVLDNEQLCNVYFATRGYWTDCIMLMELNLLLLLWPIPHYSF